MTSQTIIIHIFANIPQTTGNKTMKFGQLIKNNLKNIVLQKSCEKLSSETSSRHFFAFLQKLYIR